MLIIQIVFFAGCAIVLTSIGLVTLLPLAGSKDLSKVYSRLFLSFGAKMVLGAVALVVALKLFQWSDVVSAVGVIIAEMIALSVSTVITLRLTKQGLNNGEAHEPGN